MMQERAAAPSVGTSLRQQQDAPTNSIHPIDTAAANASYLHSESRRHQTGLRGPQPEGKDRDGPGEGVRGEWEHKLIEIEENWEGDPAGEDGWGEGARRGARYDGVVEDLRRVGLSRAGISGGGKVGGIRGWSGGDVMDIQRESQGRDGDGWGGDGDLPVLGGTASGSESEAAVRRRAQRSGGSSHFSSASASASSSSSFSPPHESAWSLSFQPDERGVEQGAAAGVRGRSGRSVS